MSIVLVIIGLIIGGVLVGQDLIRAAYVRAQLSQIEKFNTAVNTFYGKYQALPGDMNATTTSFYGFTPRGTNSGQGDGNGLIEGSGFYQNANESSGETLMFWNDLTYANGMNLDLVQGSFSTYSNFANTCSTGFGGGWCSNPQLFFPLAKLGGNLYVVAWSNNGYNFFSVNSMYAWGNGGCGGAGTWNITQPACTKIPVNIAYAIDSKIDDGYPESGRVLAMYPGAGAMWANTGFPAGDDASAAVAGSATTCYDNSGTAVSSGGGVHYSTEVNSGNGSNCALSFQFQTAR
jgi:hypothetical protein